MKKIVWALWLLLFTAPVQAATFYVATTGNDNIACPAAQNLNTPKQTINNAVKCLAPGDTLQIRAGTYNESIQDSVPSGTDGQWITICAYGAASDAPGYGPSPAAEVVTLAPTGGTRVMWIVSAHHVEFAHLIIDATNITEDAIKITSGSAGVAHHIRLNHLEVKNARNGQGLQQGISDIANSAAGSGFNEFLNLNVHHNGKDVNRDQGIYIGEVSNELVKNSRFANNAADGVQIQYQGTNNITIDSNLMENNTGGGLVGVCEGCTGIKIVNNVFRNNTGTPGLNLAIGSLSSPALVDNNQVTGNLNGGIYVYPNFNPQGNTIKMVISNNYTWSNTGFDLKDDSNGERTTLVNNHFNAPNTPPPGNQVSASVTVNIDKTAPVLTVTVPSTGSTVTTPNLTASGTISAGGSLIAVQCPSGPATLSGLSWSCPAVLVLGTNTLDFVATDMAGNVTHKPVTVTYAPNAPASIKAVTTPAPNANGWNNTDVVVTFICTGTLTCPSPVTVTSEGAGQVITGTATY